jgi:conjugative relaxase-like TrwC/TraI family protein
VLTISSGHSAAYLTDAVAVGRENYYSGAVAAGEPPGRWYGHGATAVGLSGLVDPRDMTALYAHFVDPRDPGFRDPTAWADAATLGHRGREYISEEELYAAALDAEPGATAERRVELRLDAGKRARKNVAFLDATFSVQKSITVLHTAFEAQEIKAHRAGDAPAAAAWAAHRRAVEDAIWAGNRAAIDYLATHAGYSRVGHHGGAAGRFVDAHDFVVASFFQHDSRDHDPQLHIHNAILNRVQGPDRIWRTLDGRSLYAHRGAAAAVGERTTEEHLSRSLGVRFATRPDGKAREILGVPEDVMTLFSSRRRAITAKTQTLVDAFEVRFDRAPNALELDRLQRQATFATRRAKSYSGETFEARLERWDRQLREEVADGLAGVARSVLALAGQPTAAEAWSPAAVLETALADVQSRRAAWTASDLTRAISDALPDRLGDLEGAQIATLLDGLTADGLRLAVPVDAARPGADALPVELRLADGSSAYEAPGRRLFATPEHVQTERVLAAATANRDAHALPEAVAQRFLAALNNSGLQLGAEQAAAVQGVLTSGMQIESLVGPAGTGKSFVVGLIAKAWADDGHRVFGLASSQMATEVLAGEGLQALNIARWLGIQQRLDASDGPSPDERWRLRRGDLVVIDESAMTNTADLARVHDRVLTAGAKLLLTGDHKQLAAVGAGGAMALIAEVGRSYELAEARRFTNPWEAAASLRLREGDESVLADYHKHGRLLDRGTADDAERSASRAWLADTLAGHRSLLVVDSNEQVARLNAALRAELVRFGRVAETGVPLDREGTVAGVGDQIQARANGWHLAGLHGNARGPINREQLRVLEVSEDGGLLAAPVGRTDTAAIRLPAEYVREHVTLGYAATVHAAQGRTVDTTHVVIAPGSSASAVYVGMSRGRDANTAHVTTLIAPADEPPRTASNTLHRNPAAVIAGLFETADPHRSALAQAQASAAEARSVRTAAELFADAAQLATAGRTSAWLDSLVDGGLLDEIQRAALAAEDGAASLNRLLRRAELAGHDPEQVLRTAVADRRLDDARQLSNVIHHRIVIATDLDPIGDTFADRIPRVTDPRWTAYLLRLAEAADSRMHELGESTAAAAPQWAVESFGPLPPDDAERKDWIRRSGIVAAHRELTGHDDQATPLGSAPAPGQPEVAASWRAAWRALGCEQTLREEVEMSDGQLRIRIRAWEREQAWAPRYVANELAGTSQAAAAYRADATLRYAEADSVGDPARRHELVRAAREASALAEILEVRSADLVEADHARAIWYAHTAQTRAVAERAAVELGRRDSASDDAPRTTAQQWLADQHAAVVADDPHRVITTETDLADVRCERTVVLSALDRDGTELPTRGSTKAVALPLSSEDLVRVPSADETAATLAHARGVLAEIKQRDAADAIRLAEESRLAQLSRWRSADLITRTTSDERTLDRSA